MKLVPFPSNRCVKDIVNSCANYQGYLCNVHFLQYHTSTVLHFMNNEGVY